MVVLAAAVAASPAVAKTIATTVGGPNPVFAYAVAEVVHPRNLAFRVTSGSSEPLVVRVNLRCRRAGERQAHGYSKKLTVTAPVRRKVALPFPRPADCTFGVSAAHAHGGELRWMAVTLTGEASRVIRRQGS